MYCIGLISTGAGIPYTIWIFAENSAGNGTVCNFTDFTNELRKFHCLSFVTRLQTSASAWIESPLCAILHSSLKCKHFHVLFHIMDTMLDNKLALGGHLSTSPTKLFTTADEYYD